MRQRRFGVALPSGDMASETATIRVRRETRDALAALARKRGVSLAVLLAQIADERHREAAWNSEREAMRRDAQRPEVQVEALEWEATLDDGLD